MRKNRGLIVVGGGAPPASQLRFWAARCSVIVAADSGLDHCMRANVAPGYVVGDMDSVSASAREWIGDRARFETYPTAKDYTDTELGLGKARAEGATALVVFGGGGGRMDHLIANYTLMCREDSPRAWLTDSSEIIRIDRKFRDVAEAHDMLSFFPGSEAVQGVTSTGLRWQLDGLKWRRTDFGISNECGEGTYEVTVGSGRLLHLRALRADPEPLYHSLTRAGL